MSDFNQHDLCFGGDPAPVPSRTRRFLAALGLVATAAASRCVPAPACRSALAEATRRWPGRRKTSDGICGDPAHQARVSDHNNGEAWDLSDDPGAGCHAHAEAERIRLRCRAGTETRVKYIISNRRICSAVANWDWRPYSGANPHTQHIHVSIKSAARNDTSSWLVPVAEPPVVPPVGPEPPRYGKLSRPASGASWGPPDGYWVLARDGGVFAFGQAPYLGGLTHLKLAADCCAIAGTASGRGYWILGEDGGVFAFGDARHYGSFAGRLPAGRKAVALLAADTGLNVALDDGAIWSLGSPPFFGSLG